MYSNSSAADHRPARSLRGLLVESLARLAVEAPGHHARLCDHLAGHTIDLELDADAFSLRGASPGLLLGPPLAAACRLRTDAPTIAALAAGSLSLLDAVLTDHVTIHGPVDELLHFHQALQEYLHGAVRSPSFPELLAELHNLTRT